MLISYVVLPQSILLFSHLPWLFGVYFRHIVWSCVRVSTRSGSSCSWGIRWCGWFHHHTARFWFFLISYWSKWKYIIITIISLRTFDFFPFHHHLDAVGPRQWPQSLFGSIRPHIDDLTESDRAFLVLNLLFSRSIISLGHARMLKHWRWRTCSTPDLIQPHETRLRSKGSPGRGVCVRRPHIWARDRSRLTPAIQPTYPSTYSFCSESR